MVYASAPLRLLVYYVAVFALESSLRLIPGVPEALLRERSRHVSMGPELAFGVAPVSPAESGALLNPELMLVVALSIGVALVLALPVAWVYGWTSRRRVYSRGLAQSLVVLPAAIATVVFLVKGSLALAFSLAGIVAAVRFRSGLTEVREAVYLLIAIGIGLASGVQLLFVALVSSAVYCFAALAIHRWDFGRDPGALEGWRVVPRPGKKGRPKQAAEPASPSAAAD